MHAVYIRTSPVRTGSAMAQCSSSAFHIICDTRPICTPADWRSVLQSNHGILLHDREHRSPGHGSGRLKTLTRLLVAAQLSSQQVNHASHSLLNWNMKIGMWRKWSRRISDHQISSPQAGNEFDLFACQTIFEMTHSQIEKRSKWHKSRWIWKKLTLSLAERWVLMTFGNNWNSRARVTRLKIEGQQRRTASLNPSIQPHFLERASQIETDLLGPQRKNCQRWPFSRDCFPVTFQGSQSQSEQVPDWVGLWDVKENRV
jgi:hypothetical protein